MVFLFVAIIAALFSGVLLKIAAESAGRSGKWGLNLNSVWDIARGKGLLQKVTCPKCGLEQEQRRKSASLIKCPWGGRTCPNCGTSMDQWGKAIT
jgi:ribosomal protein S27E